MGGRNCGMLGDLQRDCLADATTRFGVDKKGERVPNAILNIFEHALSPLCEDATPVLPVLLEHLRVSAVLPPAEIMCLRP